MMKTAVLVLLYAAVSVHGFPNLFANLRRAMQAGPVERELIGNYEQCGGSGGLCPRKGVQCNAVWSWAKCGEDSVCNKKTSDYYMCEPSVTNDKPKNATAKTVGGVKVLSPWTQCGGSTGDCTKYGNETCKDCPFPGTACDKGYVCYRVVEFYWQCGPKAQYEAGTCAEDAAAPAPAVSEAASRECEAPMEGMAIQGKRFKAIMMKKDDLNYERCCSYCQEEDNCVAFHLNIRNANDVVCALFSQLVDTVEVKNAVAGMIVGAVASADVAGR